ncbi:probable DNA-binding protein [Microbacterium esteraromaticum]|uniref:Probable DNA-binding protein n=1 Tax=Microbacterium esteraromaticum TaxID=57043 RepID=A0A1R4I678_9MICO|nr:helicase-associated domain-containing protein [Microbacterium esteraromaticum]SJN15288.1 probable DNA-binding protein [Microbacterium esteraromaticum]
MSTHARPLADRLAATSDAQLEELLRLRAVPADVDWDDFFDAAEALLESGSIERALVALTRTEAQLLRAAAQGKADAAAVSALASLALVDGEGKVQPPVAALVMAQPDVPPVVGADAASASATSAARAAERAFTTIGSLADLVLAARTTPLVLVSTGALSATEKRRFTDIGDLNDLRELAEIAGLARAHDRELRVTDLADDWLASSFPERWSHTVAAFRHALPRGVRAAAGWVPISEWEGAHPWDASWPARAVRWRELATRLGLMAADGTEPEWTAVLRNGGEVDTSSLESLLPTEVDRLFLQNDLTAIAPGPLQPALDTRLRSMTEHESAVQASSYRFTADSISRALADGETAHSIVQFLSEVSLTGLPQPLEYLVSQTAARHGLVRVRPDETDGTVVSSTDLHLLDAIEVDRNLRPMGLIRSGAHLVTRVGAETVAWALSDARYPATLVDRDGVMVATSRRRAAPSAPVEPVSYGPLIARLRAQQGPDSDAAWLDRELEAAVRARALVLVEVAMPDGTSREMTLEASGIGGGRLRGRDRAADVERTLPVRSIRSVRVLES